MQTPGRLAWFCALAGLLATWPGYHFGDDNQLETLPAIWRLLDPAYAPHDLIATALTEYGPRWWFVQGCAALGHVLPLPLLFLLATIGCNAAVAAVTFRTARRWFADDAVALTAVVLVLAVHVTYLGEAGFLFHRYLVPELVAMPFALAALAAGIGGRPIACAVLAAVGSLPHPLVGLEAGALGLAVAATAAHDRPTWLRWGGATAGFAAFALGVWVVPLAPTLESSQWFTALVDYRAPHHYRPSTFPWSDWAMAACFAFAVVRAWQLWSTADRADPPSPTPRRAAWLLAGVTLCLAAGWWFVDVWPVRLVASAQTYRLVFIWKWIGLMALAQVAVAAWRAGTREGRVAAALCVAGTGRTQPVGMLAGLVADAARRAGVAVWPVAVGAGVATGTLTLVGGSLTELGFLIGLGLLAWWIHTARDRRLLACAALPILLCCGVLGAARSYRARLPGLVARAVPRWTLADTPHPLDPVADWARHHTSPDAVFLTPPGGDAFRGSARRAILVGAKAIPKRDDHLAEWYRRMVAAYGPAMDQRAQHFAGLDDTARAVLAQRWGVDYAILDRTAPTQAPVVWSGGGWKVVRLR